MSSAHRVEPCPTTPITVDGEVQHIDAGIAPLVEALNRLPGIRTLASCEGHPWSPHDTRAYVLLEWNGVDVELRIWPDAVEQFTATL